MWLTDLFTPLESPAHPQLCFPIKGADRNLGWFQPSNTPGTALGLKRQASDFYSTQAVWDLSAPEKRQAEEPEKPIPREELK